MLHTITSSLALVFVLNLTAIAQAQTPSEAAPSPKKIKLEDVAIATVSAEDSLLQIFYQEEKLTLQAYTAGLVADLKQFKAGDRVDLRYQEDEPLRLSSITVKAHKIGVTRRILTLAGITLILMFIFKLMTRPKGLRRLAIGVDNRYSNSQFQIVVWFFVVIISYVAVTYARVRHGGAAFFGGVEIPQNLLLLSGLSALTFVGAKGIAKNKAMARAAQGGADTEMPAETIVKREECAPRARFPHDLFQDDNGMIDTGDFQMVVVTLAAVLVYVGQIFNYLSVVQLYKSVTLPDVDTTILASFGLGQGAYLAKKYVGEPKVESSTKKAGATTTKTDPPSAPEQQPDQPA